MMPPADRDERPEWHLWVPQSGEVAAPTLLNFQLAAEWVAPSIARERFERWLMELAWPAGQTSELVLALNEAVSNSVEHGYNVGIDDTNSAEFVHVHARQEILTGGTRRIVFSVRDHGRWQEPGDVPTAHRGHGLRIIRASGDHVVVEGDQNGTLVMVTGRTVPQRRATN